MSLIKGNCGCSTEQVDLMFKKAEQFIDEQIADRTYEMAHYWVDLYPVKNFPDGAGLTLDKVRFFGDIGPQNDGFEGWRKLEISRSAAEAALKGEHDGCGFKPETVGHGLETVSYDLMQRDLETKPICIKDIRTYFQYQEVQNLIFQNLANISANQREQLNRNAAYSYAVKHVALPGLPSNPADPYQLPVIPAGVEVGKLTYRLLKNIYPSLMHEAASYALGNLNGMPSFGVVAHPETLDDMAYEDPEIRKDIREGSRVDELITRYNFLEGMGPFILMPDMYAPRYNRDAAGVLRRVFPFERELPIEIGTRPVSNPEYLNAEFELVLILTRDLFSLRTRRPLSTVGGMTDFDAETGMFEWKWHNPERCEDPYRRVGKYVTTAEVGVEPGDFTDIPAILVKRRPGTLGISYWDVEVCPPEPAACDNQLPAQGCPCPQIVGVCEAVEDDELLLTFDRTTGAVATDVIELELTNGSFTTATVEEVSADGLKLRVSFAGPVEPIPGYFVGIRCNDISYCSSKVTKSEACGLLGNTIKLTLCRPIKATDVADVLTLTFGDGTTADAPITAVDLAKLEYEITLTFETYCENKGVCEVCVPTATNADCPDCDAAQLVDCDPDAIP